MDLPCLNILSKQANHMQSSIPRQIANKLVFGVYLLFCSNGLGQKRGSHKSCMVGNYYNHTLLTDATHCVKVTHSTCVTMLRIQRKSTYFVKRAGKKWFIKYNERIKWMYWFVLGCDQLFKINYMCLKKKEEGKKKQSFFFKGSTHWVYTLTCLIVMKCSHFTV